MADRGSYQKLTKAWLSIPAVNLDLVADGSSAGGSIAFTSPATVLRMIGEYVIGGTPGGTFAAADEVRIGLGLGMASTDAAGSGVLPDPLEEPEYPWLYWADHAFAFEGATVDRGNPAVALRRSFDIRSMRKFKPRESLIWNLQYADAAGTPPITVNLSSVRVLLGLH